MGLLNSRELATLIWAFLLLSWALTRADLRDSLVNVLKHAFADPLVNLYTAMLAYFAGMALALYSA